MRARVILGGLWLSFVGCGDLFEDERSCTLVACNDGFSITALASEGLPDGGYEIQLRLDDTAVVCTHPQLVGAPRQSGTCNAANVRSSIAIHNGGAPGTGGANAFLIGIVDAPSLVEVRVLHDGDLVGEASYEPTYQTIMPNGPECGPICETSPGKELHLDFDTAP